MEPIFEESTGFAVIEWYKPVENGSPEKHYFHKKPIRCQMHPKLTNRVVRLHFRGQMPSWIKDYARKHNFKCQQVTHNGKTGFWLANWHGWEEGNKPLSAPTLKGTLGQLKRLVPTVCEELVERIDKYQEVIAENLIFHPTAFNDFGLYFRKASVGSGVCMVIEDIVPLREDAMTDDEYRTVIENDGRLTKLIHELTLPLPDPVLSEDELVEGIDIDDEEEALDLLSFGEEVEDDEEENYESIDEEVGEVEGIDLILDTEGLELTLDDEITPDVSFEESVMEEDFLDEPIFNLDTDSPHETFDVSDLVELHSFTKEEQEEMLNEMVEENLIENKVEEDVEVEVHINNIEQELAIDSSNILEDKEEVKPEEVPKMLIKRTEKKHKMVAGQLSLF